MKASGAKPAAVAGGAGGDPQGAAVPRSALAVALLHTGEVRRMVTSALPQALSAWAGTSRLRRLLAAIVSKTILGGFTGPVDGGAETSIRDLLQEPERARQLAAQLPALLNGILDLTSAVGEGVAGLPSEDKARLLGEVVAGVDLGKAGTLLTSVARIANDARAADTARLPDALRPGVRAWARSVDFGELEAAVADLAEDGVGLAGMVSEEMWQHPAKVVCLLSVIPSVMNAGIQASTKTVEPMNRLAPDLLADVLLALTREVKGEAIGRLVNEACELWRKAHTGSVLIGEQGQPQLPEDLSGLIGEVLRSLDVGLLLKARALLAETGEATDGALCGLLESHPELVREMLRAPFRRSASLSRRLARRTDLVERALPDDEIAGEIRKGIGEVDGQELGDTVSRLLSILNTVRDGDPGVVRGVLSEALGSLDPHEVGRAVRWLVDDLVEALRPLAPEILPPLMRGLAELVTANGGERDADLETAMAALRKAVAGREEAA